jgi:hypothetical protein
MTGMVMYSPLLAFSAHITEITSAAMPITQPMKKKPERRVLASQTTMPQISA